MKKNLFLISLPITHCVPLENGNQTIAFLDQKHAAISGNLNKFGMAFQITKLLRLQNVTLQY